MPAVKKKTTKKVAKKTTTKKLKVVPNLNNQTIDSLVELIRVTSTVIPDDIYRVIQKGKKSETKGTTAEYAMGIITDNITIAKDKSQPLCQDTGTVIFYIYHPAGFRQGDFIKLIHKAILKSTKKGYLRQNSVDPITGKNDGTNLGPGHPSIKFVEHKKSSVEVKLMLKGGGCENVSAQYSLPNTELGAGRDLDGVRKVIIDAVMKAQGKGCGPGVLGVCIGGDRADSHAHAKKQLFRLVDDKSSHKNLADLEKTIVTTCNKLGIGPMGFGGKTTLLGCKIDFLNRLPASYFVSISYMCWAFRRQGVSLNKNMKITKWLY